MSLNFHQNTTLGPLPLNTFLSDFLNKNKWQTNEWKAFSQDQRVILKPPIESLQQIWSSSKSLNFAIRRLFTKNYKLEIQYPSDIVEKIRNAYIVEETFLKEESLFEKVTPKGRIAFCPINPNDPVICFEFKHFEVLKKMGLIAEKLDKLIIKSDLNEKEVEKIKTNFKALSHLHTNPPNNIILLLLQHFSSSIQFLTCPVTIGQFEEIPKMPNLIKYTASQGYSDGRKEERHRIFEQLTPKIFDTAMKRGSIFWAWPEIEEDRENFRLNPAIEKLKTSHYIHRSGHLEKILKDNVAYFEKHAPTLKEFEVEMPDSAKEFWKNREESDGKYIKRHIPLFYNILNATKNSKISVKLSVINYTFFKEGGGPYVPVDGDDGVKHTLPPTRIHFTSTYNKNGILSMGLYGQKPLIVKEIPFEEFKSFAENGLKTIFEEFFDLLESKYNLVVPEKEQGNVPLRPMNRNFQRCRKGLLNN